MVDRGKLPDSETLAESAPIEIPAASYAIRDHPTPYWTEVTGHRGTPAYLGRCDKKVYRTHDHSVADARSINRNEGRREAARAYWCRRCRGFHVGRQVGTRRERKPPRRAPRRQVDAAAYT